MAITHFLLQSNFLSTQQTFRFRSTKSHHNNIIALKTNYYSPCCIKTSPKFDIKCFITSHKHEDVKGNSLTNVATETSINGVLWRSMGNVMKVLHISVITGFLLGLLLMYDHRQGPFALAASGGRMGGSSFSSSSSSSSGSYSYPSSSSSSYSSDSSWYSRPSSYSTQIGSPAPIKAWSEVKPIRLVMFISVFILFFYIIDKWSISYIDAAKPSVLKLQVGSLGTGRSLQRDLNRIAKVADTSNSKGLHFVLQETILALLRNSEYCISGYSSVDNKLSVAGCERRFNQMSIEERGKFDEETLVNVNNIKKKSATSHSSNGLPNEYIVVTIILAARGLPKLPPIKSSEQLKKALQKLASIPSSNIMGAEVLWTPQKEDDSLTEQEMHEDYPLLRPL
ncbi:hypothetical protein HanOQP8_Chr15g0580651 [Helianthus annuus]|nr:uncharacterized protein LOC110885139 isoform X2 [Helianthus annuus]KAJ0456638.1 hypothetical protein HanIR_Chr15g0764751 [Helianthus annuus]KAJ0653179.1 hypothetical protein HanOQP8_Chr15g0580651 [Helianthus annuus]